MNSQYVRSFWKQGMIIFLLCIFCYSNSLANDFSMDDYVLFLTRIRFLNLDLSIFTNSTDGFYRPVGYGFIKLTYLLFGSNPIGYHIVNLLLFFIICMLFLLIVRWLRINSISNAPCANNISLVNQISFISIVLYCVHPINNIIVNYKTESYIAISIIFMQVSLLTFLAYIENRKNLFYILSLSFYLLSLFSYELSSILLVFLFMITYYFKCHRIKSSLLLIWPYLLCFIFHIWVLYHFSARVQNVSGIFKLSFGVYLATLSQLLQWYISKLFFPHNLLFLWNVSIIKAHVFGWALWFILFLSLIVGLYIIFLKFNKRFEIFSLSLFVVGLMPLGIIAFTYTSLTHTALIEPHWFYFSSIGFFMLLASFLTSIIRNYSRLLKRAIFCGIIMILAIMTRQSNVFWKDNGTYCKYWINLNSLNGAPYYYLDLEKDILNLIPDYFRSSGTINVRDYFYLVIEHDKSPAFLTKLGVNLANAKQFSMSFDAFSQAIHINPKYTDAYLNTGNLLGNIGKYKEAIHMWQIGAEIDPKDQRFKDNISRAMALESISH